MPDTPVRRSTTMAVRCVVEGLVFGDLVRYIYGNSRDMITRITDAGCPTVHQLGTTGPSYNPSALHSNARLTSDVLCAQCSLLPPAPSCGGLGQGLV
jgi:hypothetical protein